MNYIFAQIWERVIWLVRFNCHSSSVYSQSVETKIFIQNKHTMLMIMVRLGKGWSGYVLYGNLDLETFKKLR